MEIVQIIQSVGFPIAMCIYLMFRFEKILKANTEALENLKTVILEKLQ